MQIVLELFRRSEHIENFNKKHLYLLIREMTDVKTHYITKVVNVMKQHQKKILNEYLEVGEFTIDNDEFWCKDKYILGLSFGYHDSDSTCCYLKMV